jgi:hypothetical protein
MVYLNNQDLPKRIPDQSRESNIYQEERNTLPRAIKTLRECQGLSEDSIFLSIFTLNIIQHCNFRCKTQLANKDVGEQEV